MPTVYRRTSRRIVAFATKWRHAIGLAIAACFIVPITYFAADRTPPWVRLSGTIEPTRAGDSLTVHWITTPMIRMCPGTLQIEIISNRLIWPVMQRPVSSNLQLGQTEWTPPPWRVFRDVPPGPAIYRVTSFWYCNWLQRLLDWPIKQIGPDIPFTVLPGN